MSIDKHKPGFIYIFGNTETEGIVKIGNSIDTDQRLKTFNKNPGAVGKHYLYWKHFIHDDCESVEKALHYKFNQYRTDRENFRMDKELAKKETIKFLKAIQPLKNSNSIIYKNLRDKDNKENIVLAKKKLWQDISQKNSHNFIREAIKLCLQEGKLGQPIYNRFSAFRNNSVTKIGRIDLYALSEHLRLVVTTKSISLAKKVLKEKISNQVKITTWNGGISFFIKNQKEYIALKKWLALGKK